MVIVATLKLRQTFLYCPVRNSPSKRIPIYAKGLRELAIILSNTKVLSLSHLKRYWEKLVNLWIYTGANKCVNQTEVVVFAKRVLKVSNKQSLAEFYKDYLSRLSIHYLKRLIKGWVDHFYGSVKQRNYGQEDRKPAWWPKEVEYESPNSLKKEGNPSKKIVVCITQSWIRLTLF